MKIQTRKLKISDITKFNGITYMQYKSKNNDFLILSQNYMANLLQTKMKFSEINPKRIFEDIFILML